MFCWLKTFETLAKYCQTSNRNISTPRAPSEECLYILEMPDHWQSTQLGFKVLLAPNTMLIAIEV